MSFAGVVAVILNDSGYKYPSRLAAFGFDTSAGCCAYCAGSNADETSASVYPALINLFLIWSNLRPGIIVNRTFDSFPPPSISTIS